MSSSAVHAELDGVLHVLVHDTRGTRKQCDKTTLTESDAPNFTSSRGERWVPEDHGNACPKCYPGLGSDAPARSAPGKVLESRFRLSEAVSCRHGCGYSSDWKPAIGRHEGTCPDQPGGAPSTSCPHGCGREFTNKGSLTIHVRHKHPVGEAAPESKPDPRPRAPETFRVPVQRAPAGPFPGRAARVVQVIETRSIWGAGVDGDPVREVLQWWTLDGEEIACRDPVKDERGGGKVA